jgi:UDP-N-acetylmuramoyl-tripeptide--D-alanyl-D-alanine ligase
MERGEEHRVSWLSLQQITDFLKADFPEARLIGDDALVESISTDSRTVTPVQLFWAIKGERFDAHDFVANLVDDSGRKAAGAIVHRQIDCDLPQILVDDTYKALAKLAATWRQQFNKPLVALTGSNGKTTVKEMLAAILSRQGQVMATHGNFNNDIGMPLTLLRLREDDDYAVIEMGANHFGEIAYLTDIAKPDVAILNNAGAAHLEGFGSIKGVSRAKGEIFQGLGDKQGVAIINADDDYADYWLGLNQEREYLTFGMQNKADVSGVIDDVGMLSIQLPTGRVVVNLPLPGAHNAMNALAASAAASAVGAELASIKQGLESLSPVKGRLAVIAGQNETTLIDDTYNANPSSIVKAIDVLAASKGRKILVLGDVAEAGDAGAEMHAELGEYAKRANIDELYAFGELTKHTCTAFGRVEGRFFTDMGALLAALKGEIKSETTLLAKGSRSMRMERVINAFAVKAEEGKC